MIKGTVVDFTAVKNTLNLEMSTGSPKLSRKLEMGIVFLCLDGMRGGRPRFTFAPNRNHCFIISIVHTRRKVIKETTWRILGSVKGIWVRMKLHILENDGCGDSCGLVASVMAKGLIVHVLDKQKAGCIVSGVEKRSFTSGGCVSIYVRK